MTVRILLGDVRARLADLPAASVHCVVTSPPYWGLRDYGVAGQLGLEPTPQAHVQAMVEVFRAVRRVLRPDGVCWVNYGDSYATSVNGRSAADTKAAGQDDRTFRDKPFGTAVGGLKPKDLCMVPARFALAMQDDGWWLRANLPWVKRNPMPESTRDRPASAIEYVFMFSKSERYHYDGQAVRRAMSPVSLERLSQPNFDQQTGGPKDTKEGNRSCRKTLENLKRRVPSGWATSPNYKDQDPRYEKREDKQRGHSKRHAGFNELWDKMSVEEQQANGRNFRNTDLFYDSIEAPYGLITNTEGNPLALDVAPHPFKEAHFATFPPRLIEPLIKAGCPRGGTVLDPFGGAGTTGLVADRLGRNAVLVELNPAYAEIARKRIQGDAGMLSSVVVEDAEASLPVDHSAAPRSIDLRDGLKPAGAGNPELASDASLEPGRSSIEARSADRAESPASKDSQVGTEALL